VIHIDDQYALDEFLNSLPDAGCPTHLVGLSFPLQKRGEDLNLRPLGYEPYFWGLSGSLLDRVK
jgi:hypothetical protein